MKLYIGNLSWGTSPETLREMCAKFGAVEDVELVTDRMTGKSRGFGFVVMSTPDEAKSVIKALHGQEIDGRTLTVNEARPREERPRDSGEARRSNY